MQNRKFNPNTSRDLRQQHMETTYSWCLCFHKQKNRLNRDGNPEHIPSSALNVTQEGNKKGRFCIEYLKHVILPLEFPVKANFSLGECIKRQCLMWICISAYYMLHSGAGRTESEPNPHKRAEPLMANAKRKAVGSNTTHCTYEQPGYFH